jgi:hypothetical protein
MSTLYDSTPNDPLTNTNKARVDVSKLDIGKVICYCLGTELCYGRITATHLQSLGAVRVEVLEYGYEGERVYVYVSDITEILPETMPGNIKLGSIVRYQLAARDLPTHPNRIWRAKVIHIYRSSAGYNAANMARAFKVTDLGRM